MGANHIVARVDSKVCVVCGTTFFRPSARDYARWETIKTCSRKCWGVTRRIKRPDRLIANPTYQGIHGWMRREFGRPQHCENPDCLGVSTMYHWANLSGEYKRDRDDWKRLCAQCHKRMDVPLITHCKHGHELTPDTTYIAPKTGYRHCAVCRALNSKESNDRKKAQRGVRTIARR